MFPTHEEIFAIARAQDRIGRLAGLAVSSFAAIDCLISKANFSRLLVELDIPQPETTIVSTAAALAGPWDFPVYIKSAVGTAGSGVRLVRNEEELRTYIELLQLAGAWKAASNTSSNGRPSARTVRSPPSITTGN